jgi:hypothetical protein
MTARLVLLTLGVAGLVAAGAPPTESADPFVAGGRSTRPVAISASQADRAVARAADLAEALGMPGVSRRAERLDDRFDHRLYDEVVSFDAAGREVAIARFDPNGRVAMAISLGWKNGQGRAIGRDAAAERALAIAAATRLNVRGEPVVSPSAGAGGWSVSWPRAVDGVPVPGDGTRVSLWGDGSFHALARTERPLAAAPSHRLPAAAARKAAAKIVADQFGAEATSLRVTATELAWVAPNDTWAPERPDAPAATLRLAWLVRFEATGALTERVRLLEYWIDAGDGSLLGGDVAE